MATYVVASGGNPKPNFIDVNIPENIRYDPSMGVDIDGVILSKNYGGINGRDLYDYDILTDPKVGVSGSGLIIPPELKHGFLGINDYTNKPDQNKQFFNRDGSLKDRSDGMAHAFRLKQFVEDDQEASIESMVDDINKGRVSDIKNLENIKVPENTDIVINKDYSDLSVKGILEENSLNSLFFSEMNVKAIQDTLRYRVYKNTDQVISEQSSNDLFIIMRSIMLQYANFRVGVDNVIDEIKRLNGKVLDYAVENVSSNVKQHMVYVEDLSKLPVPMDMPVYHNKRNFTYDISNLL